MRLEGSEGWVIESVEQPETLLLPVPGTVGPKGDKGDKGDTGNTGNTGAQGIQGIQGPIGATGSQGIQGPTGSQGIQGEAGVSLDIQGTVSSYSNLPSSPEAGDAWLVADQGKLYYFDGVSWPANGQGVAFVGPQGPVGAQGVQGIQGIQGEQGIQGPIGLTGNQGIQGAKGDTGDTGSTGPAGPANSLSVGTVVGGASADATITGTAPSQVLNLVLPKGDTGNTGATGPKGDTGNTGPANSLSIGTVTGGAAADATITGSAPAQVLNLVLPKGDPGVDGTDGVDGVDGVDGAPGAPGTTTWAGITDKPSTFAPSAHSHPISDVTGLSADLAAKVNTSSIGVANGVASLDTNGKVPGSQLPNSIMTYEGLHDVVANSPVVSDATGEAGQVYRVSVAGSRNYGSGSISLEVGDYLIYSGSVWQKADTTDAVASVNGYTGNVSLTKADLVLGSVDNTADAAKNVLSASKLTTPRTINGVSFDGTANIVVPAGISRSVQTITAPTTLGAAANTDYVYFLSLGTSTVTDTDLTALLNFNGTDASTVMTDAATSPATWTAKGNAKLSTAVKKFGTASLALDGSGDYVISTSSSNFNFGSSTPFTVECWIYPANTTAGDRAIFSQSLELNNSIVPFRILQNGTTIKWYVANSDVNLYGVSNVSSASGALSATTWHHIALVGDGITLTVYVNGVSQLTATQPAWLSANRFLQIGYDSPVSQFNGYIDGFRVSKHARYTSNFTVPTTEPDATKSVALFGTPTLPTAVSNTNHYTLKNTTAPQLDQFAGSVNTLLSLDGANNSTTFTDIGVTPKTFTAFGGAKLTTSVSKFGGASLALNGTTDYVTATHSDFALGTSTDFTLEMWVNAGSAPNDWAIFDSRSGNNVTDGFTIGAVNSSVIRIWDNAQIVASSGTTFVGTWCHVAVTRSGGTWNLWINGVSQGTSTKSVNLTATLWRIGLGTWGPYFNGWVDDFRFTRGVARYSATFLPPTVGFANSIGGTAITISTTSAQTIDGLPSISLPAASAARVISDGANWRTV